MPVSDGGDDRLTGRHPPDDVCWRVIPRTLCGATLAHIEVLV